MPKIHVARYHQSKFGRLMDISVPRIIANAVDGVCRQINVTPSAIDVGAVGAACNFTLNEQGLFAGPMASIPGLEVKAIESVENACASGGMAALSVIHKLVSALPCVLC